MALHPADLTAIQQLAARYNHAIDSGDADAWAATFTPDGVFTSRGTSHEGTEALRAFATSFAARSGGTFRHWNANLLIEGDGDEATLRCYLQLIAVGGEGPRTISTGRYDDRLVRTADGWRFSARTVLGDA